MLQKHPPYTRSQGFTLVELSIVLVIIGLLVGGILVGRDLINAATIRAQISQIEKYQTAVKTFRVKYNALPGDLTNDVAQAYGFAARVNAPGQGDGNGIIEGTGGPVNDNAGNFQSIGETALFWVDLSQTNLIDGSFTLATASTNPGTLKGSAINGYMPLATIGNGAYVQVWSGGLTVGPGDYNNGFNYFSISTVSVINNLCSGCMNGGPGVTEIQAYNVDKKIDDGVPDTGRVTSWYLLVGPVLPNSAVSGSTTTCYDHGGNAANPSQYTTSVNGGNSINCGLTFVFN